MRSLHLVSVIAIALVVTGCRDDGHNGANNADGESTPTASDRGKIVGDPAIWMTSVQIAEQGMMPLSDDPVDGASSSFVAHVMRTRCSNGETGNVLPPAIEWSDTQITVTFTVDPLPVGVEYTCPGNNPVPYEVQLDQPIGQHQLVDGGCVAGSELANSSLCLDHGLRWTP